MHLCLPEARKRQFSACTISAKIAWSGDENLPDNWIHTRDENKNKFFAIAERENLANLFKDLLKQK
jgi:hypothetical protein